MSTVKGRVQNFYLGFTRVTDTETDDGKRSHMYRDVRAPCPEAGCRTFANGCIVHSSRSCQGRVGTQSQTSQVQFRVGDLHNVLGKFETGIVNFCREPARTQNHFLLLLINHRRQIWGFCAGGLRYQLQLGLVRRRREKEDSEFIARLDQQFVRNSRDPKDAQFTSHCSILHAMPRFFWKKIDGTWLSYPWLVMQCLFLLTCSLHRKICRGRNVSTHSTS